MWLVKYWQRILQRSWSDTWSWLTSSWMGWLAIGCSLATWLAQYLARGTPGRSDMLWDAVIAMAVLGTFTFVAFVWNLIAAPARREIETDERTKQVVSVSLNREQELAARIQELEAELATPPPHLTCECLNAQVRFGHSVINSGSGPKPANYSLECSVLLRFRNSSARDRAVAETVRVGLAPQGGGQPTMLETFHYSVVNRDGMMETVDVDKGIAVQPRSFSDDLWFRIYGYANEEWAREAPEGSWELVIRLDAMGQETQESRYQLAWPQGGGFARLNQ